MARQHFPLAIDGGWATDRGPTAPFQVDQVGTVRVPWLVAVDNAVYELDGWPRKMPGASKVNAITSGATDAVMGVFDYWRSTAAGTPVQRKIIFAGSRIYSEDGSGTLTQIGSGFETLKMPWMAIQNDIAVLATTSNVDVPQKWTQSGNVAALGGSPPNFGIHVVHKGRMWATLVDTNKSRLYYSALDAPEDWTGAGSGSIDIAPDDGDRNMALASHKDELLVFKGDARGSIHRVQGSAPTGSDAFTVRPFVSGVGATNHQALIRLRDDLVWADHLGLHSLVATASFGDYNEAYLTRDIGSYWVSELNHSRFDLIWGANFAAKGYALWTVTRSGAATHDLILMWDYRFSPPRFAPWPVAAAASIGMILDTNKESVPWAGTYGGFVLRLNRSARNWDGSAYTTTIRFPYLNFGDPFFDKLAVKGRVGFAPKGETNFTVGWTRDGNTQQTATVSQTGTATLAASTNQFTLDSSTLGGGRFVSSIFDLEGSFKELQLELTKGGLDEDFEPHDVAVIVERAGLGEAATLG